MSFILRVPEDQNILFLVCRKHKLFLVRIGCIAFDRDKRFGNDRAGGFFRFLLTQNCFCAFFKVLNGVLDLFLWDINEGKFIFTFNVKSQRMAAGLGEVARLITLIKLCAALCVKGLSRTCKSGARSIGCNFSSVLKPIMYLVLNESVGAPFCIEVQITVDRH